MRIISPFMPDNEDMSAVGMELYACEKEDVNRLENGKSLDKNWFFWRRSAGSLKFAYNR